MDERNQEYSSSPIESPLEEINHRYLLENLIRREIATMNIEDIKKLQIKLELLDAHVNKSDFVDEFL
jgi:hypothetical protein